MQLNIRITHAGMVCSLGLDALTACAAARAGLVRAQAVRSVNALADAALAGQAVIGHSLPCGVGDGYVGVAKALALGRHALADLASQLPFGKAPIHDSTLYLALPDRHWPDWAALADMPAATSSASTGELPSVAWRRQVQTLPERLLSSASPALRIADWRVVLGGHSAVAKALRAASQDLASGAVRQAIVGAIDSCIEPAELQAAAAAGVLKTVSSPVGFMPGEGAVFLAVDAVVPKQPWKTGAAAALRLLSLGEEVDPSAGGDDAQAGAAMAQAILHALTDLPDALQDADWDLATDLNGDARRAAQWGHCVVQMQAAQRWRARQHSRIAESLGEAGCVSGAASLAMALHGAKRGYLAPRPTLLTLSSDAGHKAALVAVH
jgi:3-oxoacyl-[acyl-carrier-protein] synthase-1